jgi:hypothetical protein
LAARGGRSYSSCWKLSTPIRITAVEASRYLDLRFDHVEKLRGELSSGVAGASAVDDGD